MFGKRVLRVLGDLDLPLKFGRRDLKVPKDLHPLTIRKRDLIARKDLYGRRIIRIRRDLVIMTFRVFKSRDRKVTNTRLSKRKTRRMKVFRIIIRDTKIR